MNLDSSSEITVLTVDDHDLVRKGIAAILSTAADMRLVGEAGNGRDAIKLFSELRPAVTLMDLRLPDMSGIDVTRALRQKDQEVKILALTSYDGDQDIYRALEAGVRGYLLKEVVHTEVIRGIRAVHAGKRFMPQEVTAHLNGFFPEVALTSREMEVLHLIARGLGNKEVGEVLGTAAGTVKAHVQSILSKLGAKDRTHAVALAIRRGIIHLHSPVMKDFIPNG